MATYTWVGGADVNGPNNWVTPTNWVIGAAPATTFPSTTADTAVVSVDSGSQSAIISNGQSITVGNLVVGGSAGPAGVQGGHVVVGGSSDIGGGGGGRLDVTSGITVTSDNSGGAIVGGLNGVINAPSMTISGGSGVIVGGGGTFNVPNIINNGIIQGDGGRFGLGALVLNSNTISGTGVVWVDGSSTVEINAATSQHVQVETNPGEVAVVVFDKPAQFTGAIDLLTPETHVDLFFASETPVGATYNPDIQSLIITGAGGSVLNNIPFTSNGVVPIVVVPSTAPGFGEIAIGGTILSDIPAPVNGVSTMTLTSTELSALLQGDQSAMRFVVGTEEVRLVDGTLSVGPDTTEAFVARLYAGLLGRAPDPVGLAAWTTALESGLSPVTAANACLASPEYQASHAEQDTTTFINTLYQSMLGRAAEPEGFAAWSQALGSGVTRGEMVAAAANSPEARQHWAALTGQGWFARDPDAAVIRVDYLAGLGRDADAGGLAAWTSVLKSGASPDQVAAAMTASPEFQTLHAQQLDSEYVNSLYLAGFGRPADPGGLAAWSNAISSGSVSRAQFLSLVAASPEAQAHVPWALN